ncbi:MAG: hypothetical protein CMH54_14830 [Myxococcales bacterium]|nr:hypothetical protein [Myxococcales bacterium]|tara:strand:- start:178 stop:405 length:228 start_codon:yes stop_codon:yes gene_type:complete
MDIASLINAFLGVLEKIFSIFTGLGVGGVLLLTVVACVVGWGLSTRASEKEFQKNGNFPFWRFGKYMETERDEES